MMETTKTGTTALDVPRVAGPVTAARATVFVAVAALMQSAIGVATAAPVAHDASGVLTAEEDDGANWLWLPRAMLFPLRVVATVTLAPLRGGAWVFER